MNAVCCGNNASRWCRLMSSSKTAPGKPCAKTCSNTATTTPYCAYPSASSAVAEVHRKYYRQPVLTEYKDDSSAVTQVDKETEMIVRDMIMKRFPDHGILGEEFPAH